MVLKGKSKEKLLQKAVSEYKKNTNEHQNIFLFNYYYNFFGDVILV